MASDFFITRVAESKEQLRVIAHVPIFVQHFMFPSCPIGLTLPTPHKALPLRHCSMNDPTKVPPSHTLLN